MNRVAPGRVAPLILLAIVAVGAVLRLHLLSKRDFWVDEAVSAYLARLPWRDFWQALWGFQANRGLYYLTLRGWLHLGDSETAIRALSVLFGLAVIPATYLLGKRMFGEKAALASAALSAVNIFQIRYSQEARAYSLVMLLAVLLTYLFLRALEAPNRRRFWIAYATAGALGIYVHFFLYLVIAAHWLSLGYRRLRQLPRGALFSAVAAFTLLTAPINAFILFGHGGQLSWVPRPSVQLVLEFSKFFTGNCSLVLAAAYAELGLVTLYWAMTQPFPSASSGVDERWSVKLVAVWLFFPIGFTLLVSFFVPVFYDRFMAVSAPALTLLAGQGMAKLDELLPRPRGAFAAALLVMLGLSVFGIYRYDTGPASGGDNWRAAVDYVFASQQPGDAVFFYRASGIWPFEYYARREMEDHGVAASPKVVFPIDAINPDQQPDEPGARHAIAGQNRVWLVLQHEEGSPERHAAVQAIQGVLQQGHRISRERVFQGKSGPIRVVLYASD
jgi:mannosyltransferase